MFKSYYLIAFQQRHINLIYMIVNFFLSWGIAYQNTINKYNFSLLSRWQTFEPLNMQHTFLWHAGPLDLWRLCVCVGGRVFVSLGQPSAINSHNWFCGGYDFSIRHTDHAPRLLSIKVEGKFLFIFTYFDLMFKCFIHGSKDDVDHGGCSGDPRSAINIFKH